MRITHLGEPALRLSPLHCTMQVLKVCAEFLIPRFMGFDELLMNSGAQAPLEQ